MSALYFLLCRTVRALKNHVTDRDGFYSDASASALDRLELLSDQVREISDGVGHVIEGVDAISFGMKILQKTAARTAGGVDNLLSAQSKRPLSPSPLAYEFLSKHHELLHLEGRQNGIAKWFFGTEEYSTWLTGSCRMMWCYGIRGQSTVFGGGVC